jgi:hypothetical protein
MPQDEPVPGPIDGLRLPRRAWKMLQQENITTLDRLKAVADRIERFERIGPKTARTIRAELTRVIREQQRYDRGAWSLENACLNDDRQPPARDREARRRHHPARELRRLGRAP